MFDDKVHDVAELYMAPPSRAIVSCVDEKSQILALDREQPVLPMARGVAERRIQLFHQRSTTNQSSREVIDADATTSRGTGQPRHPWVRILSDQSSATSDQQHSKPNHFLENSSSPTYPPKAQVTDAEMPIDVVANETHAQIIKPSIRSITPV